MTALIDADSIIYIISWAVKDASSVSPQAQEAVKEKCDSFLQYILQSTKATKYLGVFSDKKTFRNIIYKVAPYKGTRPEKSEFVREWEGFIKSYFQDKYSFFMIPGLEADDVVRWASTIYRNGVVCSPDKDLKQIAGLLFDYRKNESFSISQEEADLNFYTQMLVGDDSDNIKGVPGLGPVKAKTLLDPYSSPIDYHTRVREAYTKYYGEYYGDIIFQETLSTVMMLHPEHPEFKNYQRWVFMMARYTVPQFTTDLNENALSELGW